MVSFEFPEQQPISTEGTDVIQSFQNHLNEAEPYLRHLAWQVMDDYPQRRWDLVIGDDTGGRLVTHMIRHALNTRWGEHVPGRFICASHRAQNLFPQEAYEQYVDRIASASGFKRPLVISESTVTGGTMRFLDTHLSPRGFKTVDYAVAASRFPITSNLSGNVYVGGEGPRAASAIYSTFERVGDKSIKDFAIGAAGRVLPLFVRQRLSGRTSLTREPTYQLTNVELPNDLQAEDVEGSLPVAHRSEDPRYRDVSRICYDLMKQMSQRFAEEHAVETAATI